MTVLLGCEESQAVCIELRKLGHEAYSCDLKSCSGGHPEWHLKMDVFNAISGGFLMTESCDQIFIRKWDGAVFFPDCTFLTVSGLHWNTRNPDRAYKTERALQFVCDLMNCGIPRIAIENPVGCISTRIFWNGERWAVSKEPLNKGGRKPAQIIQPYNFGEDASKKTCLWLDNLPLLKPTESFPGRVVVINGKEYLRWSNQTDSGQNKLGPSDDRAEIRSKTYPKIAQAMALQWYG